MKKERNSTTEDDAIRVVARAGEDAVRAISNAAADAARVLASAAEVAAKVVTSAAAESAKAVSISSPSSPMNSNDHDTLITLVEAVSNLGKNIVVSLNEIKSNIKDLQDNTATRIYNLETEKLDVKDSYLSTYKPGVDDRLNKVEGRIEEHSTTITKIWSYGTATLFIVTIAEFIIARLWK